jgi:hypothetical protein
MLSIHHILGLNFFHTVEFGMKQHAFSLLCYNSRL